VFLYGFYLGILICIGTMDPVVFKKHDQQLQYNTHYARDHVSTMWYDQETAEACGMHEDILEAFGYIGAASLLSMDHASYPALTSEFLSAFECKIDKPSNTSGKVKFRLGNRTRKLTLAQWNEIFGFHNPTRNYITAQFKLKETWCLLTGMNHLPTQGLPGREIASPLFRVILRILGNTIWARKENSRPTKKEIACVHGMLFVPSVPMNMGFELLKHMEVYEGKDGEVWFGGMVTRLAEHFRVDLSLYEHLGPNSINRYYLVHSKALVDIKDVLHSRVTSGHTVRLDASLMDLLHVPNWYEVWTGRARDQDAPPGWNPETNENLRRRERRAYADPGSV
jgi:ATHILA ORF-1 family